MSVEFRGLPAINDLQKFVTPDEIKGEGAKKGFFKVCQTVTSKINRAGHALYQLATLKKPEWKSNEKVVAELTKAVGELYDACNDLDDKSSTLTTPEQVKAAIKYTKAVDKKLLQLDKVLKNMPSGLDASTKARLEGLRNDVLAMEDSNKALQQDLKSRTASKINADSTAGLQKYAQAQGKFSPILTRLGGALVGKGWINNKQIQKKLDTEMKALHENVGKLGVAMEKAQSVAMVERLERIQGNAQIKLNSLRTIASSLNVKPGSAEETKKKQLLSQIDRQATGLESLKTELNVTKKLLATRDGIRHLEKQLETHEQGASLIGPKDVSYESLSKLQNLRTNIQILTSLLGQTPVARDSGNFQISRDLGSHLRELDQKVRNNIADIESSGIKNAVAADNTAQVLAQTLRDIDLMPDGRNKMNAYEGLAADARRMRQAIDELNVPTTAAESKRFKAATESAKQTFTEASTKGEAARLGFAAIENEANKKTLQDLKTLNKEIHDAVGDRSFYALDRGEIKNYLQNLATMETKLNKFVSRGYQKENEGLAKDAKAELEKIGELKQILKDGAALNKVSTKWIPQLKVDIDTVQKDTKTSWASHSIDYEFHVTDLQMAKEQIASMDSAKDKNSPLYARSREIIGQLDKLESQVQTLKASVESPKTPKAAEELGKAIRETIDKYSEDINKIANSDLLADQKLAKLEQFSSTIIPGFGQIANNLIQELPRGKEVANLGKEAEPLVEDLATQLANTVALLAKPAAAMTEARQQIQQVNNFAEGLTSVVENPKADVWKFKQDFVPERGWASYQKTNTALDRLVELREHFEENSTEYDIITGAIERGEVLTRNYHASVQAKRQADIAESPENFDRAVTRITGAINSISNQAFAIGKSNLMPVNDQVKISQNLLKDLSSLEHFVDRGYVGSKELSEAHKGTLKNNFSNEIQELKTAIKKQEASIKAEHEAKEAKHLFLSELAGPEEDLDLKDDSAFEKQINKRVNIVSTGIAKDIARISDDINAASELRPTDRLSFYRARLTELGGIRDFINKPTFLDGKSIDKKYASILKTNHEGPVSYLEEKLFELIFAAQPEEPIEDLVFDTPTSQVHIADEDSTNFFGNYENFNDVFGTDFNIEEDEWNPGAFLNTNNNNNNNIVSESKLEQPAAAIPVPREAFQKELNDVINQFNEIKNSNSLTTDKKWDDVMKLKAEPLSILFNRHVKTLSESQEKLGEEFVGSIKELDAEIETYGNSIRTLGDQIYDVRTALSKLDEQKVADSEKEEYKAILSQDLKKANNIYDNLPAGNSADKAFLELAIEKIAVRRHLLG